MYKYDYKHLLRNSSLPDGEFKNETILRSKFSFGQEVAPNQIKGIKERCRIKRTNREIPEDIMLKEDFLISLLQIH